MTPLAAANILKGKKIMALERTNKRTNEQEREENKGVVGNFFLFANQKSREAGEVGSFISSPSF